MHIFLAWKHKYYQLSIQWIQFFEPQCGIQKTILVESPWKCSSTISIEVECLLRINQEFATTPYTTIQHWRWTFWSWTRDEGRRSQKQHEIPVCFCAESLDSRSTFLERYLGDSAAMISSILNEKNQLRDESIYRPSTQWSVTENENHKKIILHVVFSGHWCIGAIYMKQQEQRHAREREILLVYPESYHV